ncbi:hypothetical protein DFH06DRAFT_1130408 [Mycena polygramma]|nr:hypothetical protein DFH06DRAFT_1130408 [Mycena polygramma]
MSSGFLYSYDSGVVPDPEIGPVEGATWVALNGPLSALPEMALSYIDSVNHHPLNAAIDDCGLFAFMEWSSHPDWWQHDRDYRAWIPKSPSVSATDPWYMQLVKSGEDRFYLEGSWRRTILKDLKAASDCVKDITSRIPFTPLHPRPIECMLDALREGRTPEKDVRALLSAARRNMLEHLAFLDWRTSTYAAWNREDWREITIPTLLYHHISMLYPGRPGRRDFAWLTPAVLSAFKERCIAAGGQNQALLSTSTAESKIFKSLFGYSMFMDDPPTRYVKPTDAEKVIPRKAAARIIYFPGWSCRDVPRHKLRKKYFESLYFGMFGGVAVFWRYCPMSGKAPAGGRDSGDEESVEHEGTVDNVEALPFIREQYRGN